MEMKQFLGRLLPATGNYFTSIKKSNGAIKRDQRHSLDDVIAAMQDGSTKLRCDMYFSTGSFGHTSAAIHLKGKRAFYLDIDCGPGKPYATKKEALLALKEAIKAGLPKPTFIVDSGNGLHVWYAITEDLNLTQWKPYSEALQRCCEATELQVDKGITTDAARILRAPGTVNYKDPTHPKPVKLVLEGPDYSFEDFSRLLNPYLNMPAALPPPVDNSDLSDGMGKNAKAARAELMVADCPMMANTLATAGAGQPGELWHKILHVLAFCEDGHDYIHKMSSGHEKYSHKATEERFAYALQQKAFLEQNANPVKRTAPTKCDTFAKYCGECNGCEWRGKINSPIKLAYGKPSELPLGWRNGPNGVERFLGEEEGWERVIRFQATELQIAIEPDVDTYLRFKLNGKPIEATLADFESPKTVYQKLSRFNCGLENSECTNLKSLMNSWAQKLEHNKSIIRRFPHYGWCDRDFHIAGSILSKGKPPEMAFAVGHQMHHHYQPVGDVEVWKECADFIIQQQRQAANVVLASAFAAPLMPFTNLHGVLLSVVTPDSGSGKSTMLSLAQSAWGHPTHALASLNDTSNAVTNRLGLLHNLPCYWDEVRERQEVTNFIKNIFRLGQGREKQRLNANSQQRSTGTWDTMMVVASNEPLMDHIIMTVTNTDAGAARVFEITLPVITAKKVTGTEALGFFGRLSKNFGKAGEVYSQFLVDNVDVLGKLVTQMQQKIELAVKAESADRFWVATAAAIVAGATCANKAGLTRFDIKAMYAYLVGEIKRMQAGKAANAAVGSTAAVDHLQKYLQEKVEYIIRAEHIPQKGNHGSQAVIRDSLRNPAVVRVGVKDNALRLSLPDFRTWFYDKNGSGFSYAIEELKQLGAVERRGSLDVGALHATGARFYCLDVPLTGPLADVYDVADPDGGINSDLSS